MPDRAVGGVQNDVQPAIMTTDRRASRVRATTLPAGMFHLGMPNVPYMRHMRRFVVLVALAACAHKGAQVSGSAPPLLIDVRGTVMPFSQVVTHLAFRPFIPSSQVLAYAVLPPLGNSDTDAHRGAGIEYLAGRTAMLLSQWPKQNFTIAFKPNQPEIEACKPVHYSPLAVAWTTRRNLVMTLQPDGAASAAAVDLEAKRLIAAGACR